MFPMAATVIPVMSMMGVPPTAGNRFPENDWPSSVPIPTVGESPFNDPALTAQRRLRLPSLCDRAAEVIQTAKEAIGLAVIGLVCVHDSRLLLVRQLGRD